MKNDKIILWALGRNGYLVQKPLLMALNKQIKVKAVTSSEHPNIASIQNADLMLAFIETPDTIFSYIKTIILLPFIRRKLYKLIRQQGKLIHVIMCSPWDLLYLGAAKKSGLPIIVTIHDAVQHMGEESWLMDKVLRYCIRQAGHLTVLSEYVKNELMQGSIINQPIYHVDNGLVMRVEPSLLARTFPIATPKLLFFGRIYAYKGLDLLLDAMLILKAQNIIIPLTIAGEGNLAPYKSKINQLQQVSVYNKFLSDAMLLSELTSHDICILPYLEASQSAVALDALWAALPTIATPVGALPKQLKHNTDAIILKSVNAQVLADAIRQLAYDKNLYEALSKGAYTTYQTLGPDDVAKQWVKLYQTIEINNKVA